MISRSKRIKLIESASLLFHRNGLSATSLADIAKHADIPIGNVYYYFKTKEELALAVIEKHREKFNGAYKLLDEAIEDPRQRLIEAVKTFNRSRDDYMKYGFPIGKIIDGDDVKTDNVARAAAKIFLEFIEWSTEQFKKLGHDGDARRYAASTMSGIQGAVLMSKALQDPQVISDEIDRLVLWLEHMPNKKIQIGKVRV